VVGVVDGREAAVGHGRPRCNDPHGYDVLGTAGAKSILPRYAESVQGAYVFHQNETYRAISERPDIYPWLVHRVKKNISLFTQLDYMRHRDSKSLIDICKI